MSAGWISAAGGGICALAVIAGAFGAHGLKARLDADALALWDTACRYFIYAGLGLLAVGSVALREPRRGFEAAAWALIVGALIFSGTVALIAVGGPRWLGAVTPLGGLLLIFGFGLFGWTAWRL